jgi:antitoxin ParD1/3/4
MDTMNIALPEILKEFVVTRVREGGYSSASEYVRELIRADQKQKALAVLEAEILKGLNSGPAEPMTAEDWKNIRSEVRQRYEQRMADQKN